MAPHWRPSSMHSKRENAKAPGPCEETHLTWSEQREKMTKSGKVHSQHVCCAMRCVYGIGTTRKTTRLVVAVRAFNGTLALHMPVGLHHRANGRACSDAATAEAERGGDGGGGLRGELALLLGAALLLDWGLLHGGGADGTLAEQAVHLVLEYMAGGHCACSRAKAGQA